MTHRFSPRLVLAPIAAIALGLTACQPQTIRTPTPSNVGSVAESQTDDGLDASRLIITEVDLSRMEPAEMIGQMRAEMEAVTAEFARKTSQAGVAGALKQVELAGINYRTMILRVARALQAEDTDVQAAWTRERAGLRRAHSDLMATGRRLSARYPEISRDIDERFDKFDFGLLAARPGERERVGKPDPEDG